HEEFAAKGSRLAVSDAGVGVIFCKAALLGASLNVYINTAAMKDRTLAGECNRKADALLAEYGPRAERIFEEVKKCLKKE
ncbi:MAG: cyclodeaminase/cyclohydrolase family protein, partial [Spirochaetaceae bacterium]|nr:cyclodeaminase/cyclohydrolase family protein [Spirochaetaceae bacterium]